MSWSLPTGAGGFTNPTASSSNTKAVTFTGAVAVNDIIIVLFQRDGFNGTTGVDDFSTQTCSDSLGNTYTLQGHFWSSTDDQGFGWFSCIVTSAGTPTITTTAPAGHTHAFYPIAAQTYRSSITGTPSLDSGTGAAVTSNGTTSTTSVNNMTVGPLTPTSNGAAVVGLFANLSGSGHVTAGTSPNAFTGDQLTTGTAGGGEIGIEHFIQTTAASISATAGDGAVSGVRYGAAVVSLLEPVVAASARTLSLLGVGP